MKFDLIFERTYPHSIELVWNALVSAEALGHWLMETNFVAEQGRSFQMSCNTPSGQTDRYECKVIELQPPQRMLWSWLLQGHRSTQPSYIEFQLKPVATGTLLTLRHSGDLDQATIDAFKGGWPGKLDALANVL